VNIECIESLAAFDAERERWEGIERLDPYATVFTSWRWLRAYLPTARYRWFILALRRGEETIGYLPLARSGSVVDRELYFSGNPIADYTGMIALPAYEEPAINAFADFLRSRRWDACNFLDVSDPRVHRLVDRLCGTGSTLRIESTGETRCRSVALPPRWDQFLKERLSAKTRRGVLSAERRIRGSLPAFRAGEAAPDNVDLYVAAILRLRYHRWGGNRKSAERYYGELFRNAFDAGLMRIFVYWDGDRPIAGAAIFTDARRSSFYGHTMGFDKEYERFSPGAAIVCHTISAAIESGYSRYDFLRGDESYKTHYAPDVSLTRHYRIVRVGLRSAAIAYLRPKFFAIKLLFANIIYGGARSV
jgi:CelD/BcsL family acetyltransferase involved in cellulose biosynthesis